MNKEDTYQKNLKFMLNSSQPNLKRKKQLLLKNTIKFMCAANGFYISRIKISEFEKAIEGIDDARGKQNILKQAEELMKKSGQKKSKFFKCAENGLDLEAALNYLYDSSPEEHPYLLIAWKVQSRKTEMVGMATCVRFSYEDIAGENSKTQKILEDYLDEYYFIDILCVSDEGRGAGRLLVLSAFDIALRKNMKGVVAVSFSNDAKNQPDPPSLNMFTKDLKFKKIVQSPDKQTTKIYVVKDTEESFDLLNKEMLEICTRRNLNNEESFLWRCDE